MFIECHPNGSLTRLQITDKVTDKRQQEKNFVGIDQHLTWQQFMIGGVDTIDRSESDRQTPRQRVTDISLNTQICVITRHAQSRCSVAGCSPVETHEEKESHRSVSFFFSSKSQNPKRSHDLNKFADAQNQFYCVTFHPHGQTNCSTAAVDRQLVVYSHKSHFV